MSQPKYGISIVANDQTAKGVKSAEKRIGAIPKHLSAVQRAQERSLTRSSRAFARTLGGVERASARTFGNRSVISGFATRLGAISEAATAAGTGMSEAAAAGSVLGGAMTGVAAVAGATVAVLAAAAYAGFKLADGWAKGAASIGRTADIMGVARKEMQEFAAASERMGVDKGAATGALGGLSQTLNDARYGRNSQALAVLAKMGVAMKLNSDGTVNVAAMLPEIANAVARQNSSGRRTAVRALGMSESMVPVFAQGGAALSKDMTDASRTAYIASDADIARGQRIQRKGAMVGQLADRAKAIAGSAAADLAEPGYDATLTAGRTLVGGATTFGGVVKNVFSPAASLVERGGRAIERAADKIVRGVVGGAGRFSPGQIAALARKAMPLAAEAQRYGFTKPAEAKAIAAAVVLESGGKTHAQERGGSGKGHGLIQWTDNARRERFKQFIGVYPEQATREQMWRGIKHETETSEASNWRKAHGYGNDAASIAYGYRYHVIRPGAKVRDSQESAAVARAMDAIPVKVEIEMRGAPAGTTATVTSKNSRTSKPAISSAYAH